MNTFTSRLAIALFAILLTFSCSKDSSNDDFLSEELNAISYSTLENEVLQRINDHRIEIGLPQLSISDRVSVVAQSHTDYMIRNGEVSHEFFFSRRTTLSNNPGAETVSENVAFAFATSGGVVRGWLNSEAHRSVIEGDFTHFGIAVAQDEDGRNYFTNIFIKL